MSDSIKLSYSELLRELRIYHGYTQKNISDYLKITSQAYSNYECGKRTPDLEIMCRIAEFYHMTPEELVRMCHTQQLEEPSGYMKPKTVYHGMGNSGIPIPLTAKQAKMVTDILSLPPEQQNVCQKFVEFMKLPES